MKNQIISNMFEKIADILEIQGESPFKVNAYRRASRVILELNENIETLVEDNRLGDLPGIGDALEKKIEEYLSTGTMKKYEEVTSEISPDLLEMLKIQNLGPRTISMLHKKLGIENIPQLEKAIVEDTLLDLPGMGKKKVENIRRGLELYINSTERISIGAAYPIVERITSELKSKTSLDKISTAGSVRRMRETAGDIDILVASEDQKSIIDAFTGLDIVEHILGAGETKASVIVDGGRQVDLRVVQPFSFGAALQYFTGSQAHNVKLRGIARKRGYKINEYGIYKDNERVGGETEEDIYEALGLVWIPPEMREDRGEIEAAATGKIPELITLKDIRGDLHMHSLYSDGTASIEDMAKAAKDLGYEYIAICDHSHVASYARGLSEERILTEIEEIKDLNQKMKDIKILAGSEVDILSDGTLDFSDDILKKLDFVIASIHIGFKGDVTTRILTAMDNPYVDLIAHPTGRIINRRDAYDIDLNAIFKKAAATGVALEINAHPDRLDLSDVNVRKAAEMNVMIVINTDSHRPDNLTNMIFGVGNARRGWLTPQNVLNTKSYEELRTWKNNRKRK